MRKLITLALMASALIPTAAFARHKDEDPNRTSGMVYWRISDGIPARDGMKGTPAAIYTPVQFQDMLDIERSCLGDPYGQLPKGASAAFAFKLAFGLGLGAFTGGIGGAAIAFGSLMSPHGRVQQGTFAGVESAGAGFGSGLVSGGNQNSVAKRALVFQCGFDKVREYHTLGRLKGITLEGWYGSSRLRGMPAPTVSPEPNYQALDWSDSRYVALCTKQGGMNCASRHESDKKTGSNTDEQDAPPPPPPPGG